MNEIIEKLIEEFQTPFQDPILVFILILLIILFSPLLLKRINIPGIIGLILAGVIIGPHGFYILENNSAIELFSTIGLLYIMFIAGLELDLNEFKSNRNKSLLFSLFTFTIPLAIGFPACYYLLGYDFNASFLTASMFATHTLVTYPIVSSWGVSKNQAVAITVGGTILTDTAVLIVLAIIMGNHEGTLNQEFWIRLGISLAVFSAIIFLLVPRLAKWFFEKMDSEKHLHYIFVLAVVFFAAFLAELAGVEPIIGAFVAGLALNKLIPHSSALMNRIEFIGNSLFIPFFLISVGMLVDIRVILSGPNALIIAAVLTIVAVSGKWLAALFTQLVFKYNSIQRNLIFGLSGAHAAATLAVIMVGFREGILDENILNGTIILILVTSILASFVTEKASIKMKAEIEEDIDLLLDENGVSSERILLSIDQVANLEKLLEFAILIKDKKSINPISTLTVVQNDQEAEVNIVKARNELARFVIDASATETKVDVLATIDQNISSGISRISREISADIVILDWSEREDVYTRSISKKINNTVQNISKTTFVCHLEKPLPLHTKIFVAVPPYAEQEAGFSLWVEKIFILAQELSIAINMYSDERVENKVKMIMKENKLTAKVNFNNFTEWEDFLVLSREIGKDDLIILISARKGSMSYIRELDGLPAKLEKYFLTNSQFIVYPQQGEYFVEEENIIEESIQKGVTAVQKLGKGIGSIFKFGKN